MFKNPVAKTAFASPSPSAPTPAPWSRAQTHREESQVALYHWPALPSLPCPEAAAWLASRSSTRPPIFRAFRIPCRLPMYLDPNGERLRPSLSTSANISYAFHRPFPSTLRPPAPLSCMTAYVFSAASVPARWPQEPRPSPRALTCREAQSACAGIDRPFSPKEN